MPRFAAMTEIKLAVKHMGTVLLITMTAVGLTAMTSRVTDFGASGVKVFVKPTKQALAMAIFMFI